MKNPKVILITGASSGIGRALAKAYAKEGVVLFLNGRNNERLQAVAQECAKLGAVVKYAAIDVTDRDKLREWIISCDKNVPLELVVANAGISNAGENKTEEYDRKIFAINFFGVLNTVYPAIDVMKSRTRGQLAIMSSVAGMVSMPRAPAYCSSKAAVKVFGEAMRNKLRKFGMEVSVICPGFIRTPLTDKNSYKMPFIMEAEKAARIIIKGLSKNKGLIAFPFGIYFPLWLLRILPHKIAEKITRLL